MKILTNDLEQLLQTGWQSWSPSKERFIKIPEWNYNPTKEEYLPTLINKKRNKKPIAGWCSWYAYGGNICEEKILKNALWFSKQNKIPVKYILIDGGWTKLGDWEEADKDRFPHGIKYLSEKIRETGLLPGIWISPFLADTNSKVFSSHPDWFVKNNIRYVDGLRIFFLQSLIKPKYILDVRKSDVKSRILETVVNLVKKNKLSLLKMDYLYSIYFIPGISGKEAGRILKEFLIAVKKELKNVYTIACGCPLIPAIAAVDSMRIGPDIISPEIDNKWILTKTINTHKLNCVIKSVEKRLWTRKYWNLDPDAFVCRKSVGLSDEQIIHLRKTIKKAEGNIFLGDNMTALDDERINKFIIPLFKI